MKWVLSFFDWRTRTDEELMETEADSAHNPKVQQLKEIADLANSDPESESGRGTFRVHKKK